MLKHTIFFLICTNLFQLLHSSSIRDNYDGILPYPKTCNDFYNDIPALQGMDRNRITTSDVEKIVKNSPFYNANFKDQDIHTHCIQETCVMFKHYNQYANKVKYNSRYDTKRNRDNDQIKWEIKSVFKR